jgi:hypothetical protein
MEIPILKESGVVFNENDHTYFLGDKQLKGITSTLIHRVFPHDYDGVPQEKLDERAEYGHKVHDMIEFCVTNGLDSEMAEWQMFKQIADEHRLRIIHCEYTRRKCYPSGMFFTIVVFITTTYLIPAFRTTYILDSFSHSETTPAL